MIYRQTNKDYSEKHEKIETQGERGDLGPLANLNGFTP